MKYTIVKTYDPQKFKFFMAYCYESDPEFIEKYVMGRPATIEEMVERATLDLGDTSKMVMFTITFITIAQKVNVAQVIPILPISSANTSNFYYKGVF